MVIHIAVVIMQNGVMIFYYGCLTLS
jgi:hypothetical protein